MATEREKELEELVREMDLKAEAGLCQFSFGGAREFLKDIRRLADKAGLQGGITKFDN